MSSYRKISQVSSAIAAARSNKRSVVISKLRHREAAGFGIQQRTATHRIHVAYSLCSNSRAGAPGYRDREGEPFTLDLKGMTQDVMEQPMTFRPRNFAVAAWELIPLHCCGRGQLRTGESGSRRALLPRFGFVETARRTYTGAARRGRSVQASRCNGLSPGADRKSPMH